MSICIKKRSSSMLLFQKSYTYYFGAIQHDILRSRLTHSAELKKIIDQSCGRNVVRVLEFWIKLAGCIKLLWEPYYTTSFINQVQFQAQNHTSIQHPPHPAISKQCITRLILIKESPTIANSGKIRRAATLCPDQPKYDYRNPQQ